MEKREPRWPAILAALGVGGLYLVLPDSMTVGPRWLPLVVVAILLMPVLIFYRQGKDRLNELFGYTLLGSITSWLLLSLVLLIKGLLAKTEAPQMLLLSAALLWVSNILVFASRI